MGLGQVHDIGLVVTPMAYFAQFALDVPGVAMVRLDCELDRRAKPRNA